MNLFKTTKKKMFCPVRIYLITSSMCLLVQAKKQYKHQYEQEDLLCLELDHLPLSQCFQISVNYQEKDHN